VYTTNKSLMACVYDDMPPALCCTETGHTEDSLSTA